MIRKRIFATLIIIVIFLSISCDAFACNPEQSNYYEKQLLFGDNSLSASSNEKLEMLLKAVYLCCEQADGEGQNELSFLKSKGVRGLPELSEINIKRGELLECSHNTWNYNYSKKTKEQALRKDLLKNTVNKVFDFGLFDIIKGDAEESDKISALLYYFHILADYLADNPEETTAQFKSYTVPAFCGQPYINLNGGKPEFSAYDKQKTESFLKLTTLDSFGRSGIAFANISKDMLSTSEEKNLANPSGWKQNCYNIVSGDYLYNRSHLIAHELAGYDEAENLITGTRYLNNGMRKFESDVKNHVKNSGNHVLYRATPIFKGNNLVASGVQIEAYSVEDKGKGISFNVYCYNVQPGIEINYDSGSNQRAAFLINNEQVIPFARPNANSEKPDLIYEINNILISIFEGTSNQLSYQAMMNELKAIATDARYSSYSYEDNPARGYLKINQYEYEYFNTLKRYMPSLLQKEVYFRSAFNY